MNSRQRTYCDRVQMFLTKFPKNTFFLNFLANFVLIRVNNNKQNIR